MTAEAPIRFAIADNLIQPFQVEGVGLRGRLVRLGSVLDEILTRHDYPDLVSGMLGEALTLTAALAAALKFDGIFTLQTKGDGPIGTMVADYRTPGDLRGYAGFDAAAIAALAAGRGGPSGAVPRLLGAGYLAFTVDQGGDTERYQGIVELAGATLADCAHKYFLQSEQLEAGIRLAVRQVPDADGTPRWRGGALMLQRLPGEGPQGRRADDADEAWRRALLLMGTASDAELVDRTLPARDLLYRLFHEDGVRVWQPLPLGAGCRCSRERVAMVLGSFPPAEVAGMASEGRIEVTCEFCNSHYAFALEDLVRPEAG
ncbi:MAG TPA: Hsp33 family molecular chaperone [Candidatus Sulfotelmatobacter sp.]|nr:Hsp33 family molecular chaperone [Candidatus Sulfotelmatobacter sp.]